MSIRAVKAQTTENQFNNLLVTMGRNVDEAVGKAIAALLHSNSHIVAGVMESAVAIQELELSLDHAVFSALERGDLPRSEVRRMTSIVNISKDLARLGKLAANLGRKVTEVGSTTSMKIFPGSSRWPSPSLIFAARLSVPSPG
jgi:phosphate uptake regulator